MRFHRLSRPMAGLLMLFAVEAASGQSLRPVPTPSLGGQSAEVRQLLNEARTELEGRRGAEAAKLAAAYGRLGARYLHVGLLDAARPALLNAVALAPETMRWRYYLAVCQERLGETEEAITNLRQVLAHREGNLPAVLRLAGLLANRGELDEARHLYRAALQSPLGVPAGRAGLARLSGEDVSAAIEHYRVALEAQPAATALHRRLSHALAAAGRSEEAQSHLRKAGDVEVRYPDPLMVQLAIEMKDPSVSVQSGPAAPVPTAADPALEAKRRAVETSPDDLAARRELARALLAAGDRDAARGQYGEILRRAADDADALLEAGTLDFASGRHEEGLALLGRAVSAAPRSPLARQRLAAALVAAGRSSEVVPHLEAVIELQPADVLSRLQLSQTLLDLGRFDDAIQQLDELLVQHPGHHEGLVLQGRVEAARNRPEAAQENFERVAGLDSASPAVRASAHFNLGLLHQASKAIEAAVTSYQKALTFDAGHPQALFNLALIRASNGQLDEAVDLYQRLFDLEPENRNVRYRLAVSQLSLGDHWSALGHFEALYQADPSDLEVVISSALLMAEVGQREQAMARLEQALAGAEDPQARARLLTTRSGLYRASGSSKRALTDLELAVAAAPDAAEARLAYGRALALETRFTDAAEQYDAYLRLEPDDEPAHFARAMALILADRFADARDALLDVTSRMPSVPLTHLLARILASAPEPAVRDGERAVQIAQKVFEVERNPAHGETVAMAMAAAGRFDEAVTLQNRLLEEARAAKFEAAFIERVERNLARYQADLPGVSDW